MYMLSDLPYEKINCCHLYEDYGRYKFGEDENSPYSMIEYQKMNTRLTRIYEKGFLFQWF